MKTQLLFVYSLLNFSWRDFVFTVSVLKNVSAVKNLMHDCNQHMAGKKMHEKINKIIATNYDKLQLELWDRSYLANMDVAENYNVQAVS